MCKGSLSGRASSLLPFFFVPTVYEYDPKNIFGVAFLTHWSCHCGCLLGSLLYIYDVQHSCTCPSMFIVTFLLVSFIFLVALYVMLFFCVNVVELCGSCINELKLKFTCVYSWLGL